MRSTLLQTDGDVCCDGDADGGGAAGWLGRVVQLGSPCTVEGVRGLLQLYGEGPLPSTQAFDKTRIDVYCKTALAVGRRAYGKEGNSPPAAALLLAWAALIC